MAKNAMQLSLSKRRLKNQCLESKKTCDKRTMPVKKLWIKPNGKWFCKHVDPTCGNNTEKGL